MLELIKKDISFTLTIMTLNSISSNFKSNFLGIEKLSLIF